MHRDVYYTSSNYNLRYIIFPIFSPLLRLFLEKAIEAIHSLQNLLIFNISFLFYSYSNILQTPHFTSSVAR